MGVWLGLSAGCGAEPPAPAPHSGALRTSQEVFRMFCMRVARDEHPTSHDGAAFDAPCDGREPLAAPDSPRLSALIARRGDLVDALDQVFAEAAGAQVAGVAPFAEAELQDFLASLLPFYDDESLPRSTRALAQLLGRLLDPGDARAGQVLDGLARLSARVGYRPASDSLALLRPLLSYERLDPLSQQLLGFVGEGGAAHDALLQLLEAAALELAEPTEPLSDGQQDDTTLHLATQLLLRENAAFAAPGDPVKYIVRRDSAGEALRTAAADAGGATPFPPANRPDVAPRSADGRALAAPGSADTLYQYADANRSLLAALLRDQERLLARKQPGQPSPIEQLLRGLRPLLGPNGARRETFRTSEADVSADYRFSGPQVEQSPLLDLVHALSNLLRYPETSRVLALLQQLLQEHESTTVAPLYAGLAIDGRADQHPEALLTGVDGQPGTPQELWDDLIDIGMKMAARPGLLKDVVMSFAKPEGAAQARLIGRFMQFSDEITYQGAPLSVGADGRYSEADARTLNTPIVHDLAREVLRMEAGDVGMNRSLFQRLMSTIHATSGAPACNKDGAELPAKGGVFGIEADLTFPDPGAKDPLVGLLIPVLYPDCPGPSLGTRYQECALVEQPSGAEAHMRSLIGRAEVRIKDPQLLCLAAAQDPPQDIGATQARDAQIEGFTLSPTPEAIARFLYAPRNEFMSDMFSPMLTRHGVPLVDFEPNLLFALEVRDPNVAADGVPQSFLSSSAELLRAFDDHETFDTGPNGPVSRGGYLFADLLSALHLHWDSRRQGSCPRDDQDAACVALGLSGKACNAGCTQSLDPEAGFYSKQTGVVRYEPLLTEALLEENLADILADSVRVLASLQITCEDAVTRDGVTILSDFLERALTPDPALYDYATRRSFAKTNTCVLHDPSGSGEPRCDCPRGSMDVAGKCTLPGGGVVPRGRLLPQTTPLHLVLDGLARFDAAFADSQSQGRLGPWRAARSELVDVFLSVDRVGEPASADPVYVLANPRARAVAVELLGWLRDRVDAHRGADDLDDWARELPDRLASVLGHPLLSGALDLLDALWETDGPAEELSRLAASLLDPDRTEVFAGLALAAADTLELVDRDRALSPLIQFAAVAIADNAFAALDAVETGSVQADVESGAALRTLELTRKIADLQRGKADASVLSKLLKNAVLGDPTKQGRAPLETLLDAVADINRVDARQPTTAPHSSADNREVFERLRQFLTDPDRGLERLYSVVRERELQ